jgi:hypothetical protein
VGLVLVGVAAIVAIALASVALFVTLTRQTPSTDTSCRVTAWQAIPATDTLPEGWTLSGSGFYSDGYGAAFVGQPTASGQTGAPGINVRVSCLGADGHLAVTRSRQADLALGGTDVPFADIGDEAVATKDAAGTTTSVYVRRGPLVASIAASETVDPADLEQLATAVDDAMVQAEASAGAPEAAVPSATDEGGVEPSGEIPTGEPGDSLEFTHTYPDLEAILPTKVGGTTMVTDSTTASDALGGDPASEQLLSSLAGFGKTSDDLEFAETYDLNNDIDAGAIALRLKGVDAAKLRQAIVESWTAASGSGVTTSQQTVGGKKVTVIDYGDGGSKDYLYEKVDTVVVVTTGDGAIAAEMLGALK